MIQSKGNSMQATMNTTSSVEFGRKIDREMSFLQRKQTGSFYTADSLTAVMIDDLICSLPDNKRENLFNLRFLEPCVGTGSFVFAYLMAAKKLSFTQEQYNYLLNNIYVCDINKEALDTYSLALFDFALENFGIELDEEYFSKHVGAGLLFDLSMDVPQYTSIDRVFGKGSENSFDIVITNPPYKNLKADRSHYPNDHEYAKEKIRYSIVTEQAIKHLQYSVYGVNNIYKYFVEEILERYATKNGVISLLIPSSILTDKTCELLRKRIFTTAGIKSIITIREGSNVVDSQQALCVLQIHKQKIFSTIDVCQDYDSSKQRRITVSTNKAFSVELGYSILLLEPEEYIQFEKLKKHPKIRDLDFIINMRGELDLTNNKNEITKENTRYPLIRGRNIGYYKLINTPTDEFARLSFIDKSTKKIFIKSERIICQQIANMLKDRRLTFSLIPENTVLANSCNFVTVKNNNYDVDLYFMLGLLNSSLMNWYFKLQSSNNHINNYEIGNLPFPLSFSRKAELADLVRDYINNPKHKLIIDKIDELVSEAFGLIKTGGHFDIASLPDTTIFDKKVIQAIIDKQNRKSREEIFNHITFKLSELDMEMIRAVPQGGSWKNIPAQTIAKSKRLIRITETGGRTTLYGRIDYNKPSYTITTYFNRPGNGSYIHPVHDRVISVREAARLQSFPDDYFFYGNKSQLLNQIGNAVPPLFAYQIAKNIKEKVGNKYSLDLFCGAGGMTLGFKQAGIKSILSTDIDLAACITLKINNPEIQVLAGDITQDDVKKKIIDTAINGNVDLICGGPPCQGFSMAGFRLSDDPRNQLFIDFINIVSHVKPKIVVFENVEGLLTFQQGNTYRLIHDMFSEIGYKTEGRLLKTQYFGVPQKRKRVIIICIKNDIPILTSDLFPISITTNESSQITAKDAIYDLEKIECSEQAKYDRISYSKYVAMLKGEISQDLFLKEISSINDTLFTKELYSQQFTLF